MYTLDGLLIKDVKRLWPIHTVQISSMQYAFGVQVYGEVLHLEFYLKFSQNSLLTMKYCSVKDCKCMSSCENGILRTIKGVVDFIRYGKQILHLNIFRNHPRVL